MRGKCDDGQCSKRAVAEYLIQNKCSASTLKFCEEHKPKYKTPGIQLIYGK